MPGRFVSVEPGSGQAAASRAAARQAAAGQGAPSRAAAGQASEAPYVGEPFSETIVRGLERARLELRHRFSPLPIGLLVLAYAWHFSSLSITVYEGYNMPPYDLAVWDQGLWLLSRFDYPFSSVMGRNLFGDHTSYIFVLFVPLYWIWPHVQGLLVAQAVLLASAAVPIYLLALQLLDSVLLASALAAAYLLNPALQWGNLEQFHPECFLVMSIAWAIYAAVRWRPWLLGTMVVLSLLVKEDAAILVIPLGLWVLFRGHRRAGAAIVVGAAGYMALCFEVFIPALLGTGSLYTSFMPFGSLGGALRVLVAHPVTLWRYASGGGRPFYLWQMLSSFGFVFLRRPELAAVAALVLVENTGSTLLYMQRIEYHYSLPIVPVLAIGTVWAVAAVRDRAWRLVAAALVLGSALAASILWGLAPFARTPYPYVSPSDPATIAANRVVDTLPSGAAVSAYWTWVSHIDHRTAVYMWPNPFENVYFGDNKPNAPLRSRLARRVQYLMLPCQASFERCRSLPVGAPNLEAWAADGQHFRLVELDQGIALYRRISPGAKVLGS